MTTEPDQPPVLPTPISWRHPLAKYRAYRKRQKTSADLAARDTVVVTVVAAISMLLAAGFFYVNNKSDANKAESDRQIKSLLQCVTDWSVASTNRSTLLSELSNERNSAQLAKDKAEYGFLVDIASAGRARTASQQAIATRRTTAAFARLIKTYKTYVIKFVAYDKAAHAHPVPPAPTLSCPGLGKLVKTSRPSPAVLPTVTQTKTATTKVPGPTKTRTTRVPGPTVTRVVPGPTRTRTVCLRHNGRPC